MITEADTCRKYVLPKLQAAALGYRATVMGAITTLIHNTFDFYVARKLP